MDIIPKHIRYFTKILSGFLLLTSVFVLILGLFHYWKFEVIGVLVGANFNPVFCIVGESFLLFFIGGFGFFAINQGRKKLLYWYYLSLFVVEVVYNPASYIAFTSTIDGYQSQIEAKDVRMMLHNYLENKESKRIMDLLQSSHQCCGLSEDGYKDWNNLTYYQCDRNSYRSERCSVPKSCCKKYWNRATEPKCNVDVLNNSSMTQEELDTKINTNGCLIAISEMLQKSGIVLLCVSFGPSLVMAMGSPTIVVLKKILNNNQEQQSRNNPIATYSRNPDVVGLAFGRMPGPIV